MAFTGTPVLTKVSDRVYRITGVSLASGADGTIGLSGGTGDVDINNAPEWGAYAAISGTPVTLQDAVRVVINPVTDVSNYAIPIRVVKTGTTQTDFLITLTNDSAATASATLEIYVEFH